MEGKGCYLSDRVMLQKKQFKPSCEVTVQLSMQYLPDQFPPAASTGSCRRFLGIVHSWGDTVPCSRPRPGGHYGIGEATDFFFLLVCFCCFFLTHLPQASVVALCTIWEKKNNSLLDLAAVSLAKPQPWACMRALTKNPVEFLCPLLYSLWSLVLIHSQGQVQVCFLLFTYVGSDLYLSTP